MIKNLKAYYNGSPYDRISCIMLIWFSVCVNLDAITLIIDVYNDTFKWFGFNFWSFVLSFVVWNFELIKYDEFKQSLK